MDGRRRHVMVLSYPAQGHINPLLQFAKRLASKGVTATFLTTPYIIPSVRAHGVNVELISDGYDKGGLSHAPCLEAYLESFRTNGSRTLTDVILKFRDSASPVDCIVYDALISWPLQVATELGIRKAAFFTFSASTFIITWHVQSGLVPVPVRAEDLPVSVAGLPPLGLSDLPSFLLQPGPVSPYLTMTLEKFSTLHLDDWIFLNSFNELEIEVVKAMPRCLRVEMVGPLVPSAFLDQQIDGDKDYGGNLWKPTGDQCMRWLDEKPPKSVVYISFGSMAEIAPKQVEEIACGLIKSKERHFLWVVKDPERNKMAKELLHSVGKRGLIVTWCNQLKLLAHESVGCFVTHCGWNSVLETVSLGVPMITMPQRVDQFTNAMCVEKVWRVGVRAKEDEEGLVRREEIEMCIAKVMDGAENDEIGRNASKMKELARRAASLGGSSDGTINKFIRLLQNAN